MALKENTKIIMDISDEDISTELIDVLLKLHEPIVSGRFKVLDNYYKGNQDILNRVITDEDKPNNKPVTNMCSYITDVSTGFFLGNPVTYTSTDKEYLDILTEIFNENDEQEKNHNLGHKSSIKGQSFELNYRNEEGKNCFDCLDTDSVIMVYDSSIRSTPSMAVRYYTVHNYLTDKDIIKIDVYTKTNIYHYTKNEEDMSLDSDEAHYYKEVPIPHFENNRFCRGDFENIITLQDMFNKNTADISNDIEYFSNCYLGIGGAEGTTKEDVKVMKEDRVIIYPAGGKAEFIVKQINDQVVQNHRNNLSEDIHKTSYVPDLSKEIKSNVSGEAIKTLMYVMSDIITTKERKFKKFLQTRIRLITTMLNLNGYKKNGVDIKTHEYDYKDITINFHRNIPNGLFSKADDFSKMKGIVSDKTLMIQAGIEDTEAEKTQMDLEKNSMIDLDNLHTENDVNTDEQ